MNVRVDPQLPNSQTGNELSDHDQQLLIKLTALFKEHANAINIANAAIVAAGAAAAPVGASYLTLGTNAALTNERVLTAGTNITFSDGGPGSTLTVNASGGGSSDAILGQVSGGCAQYQFVCKKPLLRQGRWHRGRNCGHRNLQGVSVHSVHRNCEVGGRTVQC